MVRGRSANVPKAQGQKTQHKGAFLSPAPLVAGLKYCFYWGFGIMPFFFLFFSRSDQMFWCQKKLLLSHISGFRIHRSNEHSCGLINSKVGALYHQRYVKRTQRKSKRPLLVAVSLCLINAVSKVRLMLQYLYP